MGIINWKFKYDANNDMNNWMYKELKKLEKLMNESKIDGFIKEYTVLFNDEKHLKKIKKLKKDNIEKLSDREIDAYFLKHFHKELVIMGLAK